MRFTGSNEGDKIFDPFSGIMSLGVACQNTGRRFVGCELDEKYFEIGIEFK